MSGPLVDPAVVALVPGRQTAVEPMEAEEDHYEEEVPESGCVGGAGWGVASALDGTRPTGAAAAGGGRACPKMDAPHCSPPDCSVDTEMPDCEQTPGDRHDAAAALLDHDVGGLLPQSGDPHAGLACTPDGELLCTAGGKRYPPSDFNHCPTPQSFVRCGPHHRAKCMVLSKADVKELHRVWRKYQDDLTWPWYDKKPMYDERDYMSYRRICQKVVDAMVAEYRQPMVFDQATISNTNHVGHPPHADNVQFDSVWWKGKRIRQEDEVVAAQEGAYVLWRTEKTSYRSYACSVPLVEPDSYEGGEVQFFAKWGDKDPIESHKLSCGQGVMFCGCSRNIHAVTGVKSGFRLVLLIWTRPPHVRVPENQTHVCYFRPGTGLGCWLTTADEQRCRMSTRRWTEQQIWVPKEEEEDSSCPCRKCVEERKKVAWKDCSELDDDGGRAEMPTPPTSAGSTPRGDVSSSDMTDESPRCASSRHCPHPQGNVRCGPHERVHLDNVVSKVDMRRLYRIWRKYKDDLSWPWYEKKPDFSQSDFNAFRAIAQKVVDAMAIQFNQPLVLDQATVSNTNHLGHPPHADNVQFDSVWWRGTQIKQKDELVAARGGAEVLWKESKTSYRNYSASVALCNPSDYGGGDLEFYGEWGEKEPRAKYRCRMGCGVAFCGCQASIHAVTGVRWGFRLMLLIWTRPPDAVVPEDQKHVCYFRPGTGRSIWLTTADLEHYPRRRQKRQTWMPIENASDQVMEDAEEEEEEGGEGEEDEQGENEEEDWERKDYNAGNEWNWWQKDRWNWWQK